MFNYTTPKEVVFTYQENWVVPISAIDGAGAPYTGHARGQKESVEWDGPFVAGRPHGKFSILWGGRDGGEVYFEHGKQVTAKS